MSFQRGIIDLSNYTEEDLIVKKLQYGLVAIQVEGSATVSIKGKTSALDDYVNLCVINLGTLTKSNNIAGAGAYLCGVNGLDELKFEVSGTGKISWKELGD